MADIYKNTEAEQNAIANKVWWYPAFDGYAMWMDIAVNKKGMTLEQILEKATQEWLDHRADEMFDPHFTVEQFREYATYRYNNMKAIGFYK